MTRREYVLDRITPEPNSGCWLWDLSTGSHGYGQGCDPEENRVTVAHRISYRAFKGEIPEGLHIDHKCRNRLCVNPDHLEAVPQAVNNRRRRGQKDDLSTCPHGHPRSSYFTDSLGRPVCRECHRARHARYRAKRRTARAEA